MSPEKQRIAIAEACGWRPEPTVGPIHNQGVTRWRHPNGTFYGDMSIPDYLNDLNAMHEAEKVLNYRQLERMHMELATISNRDQHGANHPHRKHTAHDFMWHATSSQRAEAFLRTIGKWEEE